MLAHHPRYRTPSPHRIGRVARTSRTHTATRSQWPPYSGWFARPIHRRSIGSLNRALQPSSAPRLQGRQKLCHAPVRRAGGCNAIAVAVAIIYLPLPSISGERLSGLESLTRSRKKTSAQKSDGFPVSVSTVHIPHPTHLRRRCGMRLFPPRPPPPAPASRRGVFRLVSGSRLVSGPCAGGGSLSSGEIAHRAVTRLPEKHSDVPCHDPAFDEGPPRAPSSRFLRAACKTRTTLFSLPPPVRRLPSEGFHSRRARPRPPASSLLGKTESLETSRDDASPHPTKPRTCHFNRATTS